MRPDGQARRASISGIFEHEKKVSAPASTGCSAVECTGISNSGHQYAFSTLQARSHVSLVDVQGGSGESVRHDRFGHEENKHGHQQVPPHPLSPLEIL